MGLLTRALSHPRVAPELLQRAAEPPPGPGLFATWTGVAGLRLEHVAPEKTTTLLFDPYVTRQSFAQLALPLGSDEATALRAFPTAAALFVGHSHHDHLADAIPLALRTGATIYGSATTCMIARAGGVPASKCMALQDGQRVTIGPFEVQAFEHVHGSSALGIPFPGEVTKPPPWPPFIWQLKAGHVLAFAIRVAGKTLYHQGSGGLTDHQLTQVKDLKPEIAFIGIALRQNTPDFEERLFGALQPKTVVAMHHDDFFGPTLTDDFPHLRGVDLPAFVAKTAQLLGAEAYLAQKPFARMAVR